MHSVVKQAGQLRLPGCYGLQGREQTVEGNAKLRNAAGYCESVDAGVAYGQETRNAYRVALDLPRFRGLPAALRTRAFQAWRDWERTSSHTELQRGLSVALAAEEHSIGYELTWRDTEDASACASRAIRRQLGHTLASSVKYSYVRERRDSAARPMRGYALSFTSELGGIGLSPYLLHYFRQVDRAFQSSPEPAAGSRSDHSLMVRADAGRQEAEAHYAVPLGLYDVALNVGCSAGHLLPWGPAAGRPTPLASRFFLGGPSSFRGFRTRGVGPTDVRRLQPDRKEEDDQEPAARRPRDALGGDLLLALHTALTFPLPSRTMHELGFHGHVFTTVGNVVSLGAEAGEPPPSLHGFFSTMRVAAGLGVVWATRFGRLEANYCRVLRKQEHDHVKRGVQIGFTSAV
eukprot:SM000019S05040  [mRNA]  locus=s19:661435:664974:+ [translate_table: standard]